MADLTDAIEGSSVPAATLRSARFVMFGIGGVYTELPHDVGCSLAPDTTASRPELLGGLRGAPLLARH